MSRHCGQPPAVARIAEIVVRHVLDLRLTRLQDAAEAAAVRVLADAEIAAGLRALPILAALDALHSPRRWAQSDVVVCDHCNRHWPCDSRRVLSGEMAEVA